MLLLLLLLVGRVLEPGPREVRGGAQAEVHGLEPSGKRVVEHDERPRRRNR